MDGAGACTGSWHVTWPMLRPTSFFFVLVTSTVKRGGRVAGVDLVFVDHLWRPRRTRRPTVVYYAYQQAFQFGRFGYAGGRSARC
ncbi:hypothetical protein [Saccharopolyspora gregorii]|uniref:Secreted protein n=1 Tax=Saccharopolyspora gregorii TaxID=33914 RepID=A0ABP6S2H9_9PSEU